ncbi:MAG: site-2 protease family protein [Actinomycetota bacterium]
MARSIRIARIAGTPVSVDIGLAVLAAVFIASLTFQGFARLDPTASVGIRFVAATATVVVFLGSVLAHELGHAVLAKRNDVGVLGITLSLFGGFAQLDRQAPTPRAEFTIAAAGPAVNLIIGAILAGVTAVLHGLGLLGRLALGSLAWLAVVNIVLAIVNLFPAAPLDGGRVLTAALWKRLKDAEYARIISGRSGLLLGATLLVGGTIIVVLADSSIGRWQGLIILVVGVFLFNGARGEIGAAVVRRRLATTATGALMVPDPPAVSDSLSVEQFQRLIGPDGDGVAYPVVRWSAEPIGYVPATAGQDLDGLDRSRTTVLDVMQATPDVARAWRNEPVDAVLKRLGMPDNLLVVIHEPSDGRAVGTLSETQIKPLLETPNLWGGDRTGNNRLRSAVIDSPRPQ